MPKKSTSTKKSAKTKKIVKTTKSAKTKKRAKTPVKPTRKAPSSRKTLPQKADPYADVTRQVSFGCKLKARPKKAKVKHIGIVPVIENALAAPAQKAAKAAAAETADLIFPANAGAGDTKVVNHGGAIASGVPVELIFWGSAWNTTANSQLRAQLVAAASGLISGPYFRELKQYGANRPTLRGAITMTSPNPPAAFDDGTIGDAVWNLIDANVFPEPDDPGGRNFYCMFMPPGTTYGPGARASRWIRDSALAADRGLK